MVSNGCQSLAAVTPLVGHGLTTEDSLRNCCVDAYMAVMCVQAEASTSALASREEQVGQLQEQLQQADCQVENLQQAQASLAADAAAKASKLAHLEGAVSCICCLLAVPTSMMPPMQIGVALNPPPQAPLATSTSMVPPMQFWGRTLTPPLS